MLVADGAARDFDGDVEDYLDWLNRRRGRVSASDGDARPPGRDARRADRDAAAARKREALSRRRPLRREATHLESDIANWQREKTALEARLADPALYASGQPEEIQAVVSRCAALAPLLAAAEDRWLALQAELEAIGEPDGAVSRQP
jgi:ATP-binding cassette subfamily F protein 3